MLARYQSFFRWAGWFLLANILFAQLIGLRYFVGVPQGPDTFLAWVWVLTYWCGQFASLGAVVFLLLTPIYLLTPFYRVHRVLSSLLGSLLLSFILADTFVYSQYRFHINKFVLDLFFMGKGQIISFSWFTWALFAMAFFGVWTFQFFVAGRIWNWLQRPVARRRGWLVFTFYVLTIAGSHVGHIFADGLFYQPITRLDHIFPLSEPATDKNRLTRWGLVNVDESKKRAMLKMNDEGQKSFHYPNHSMECGTPEKMNVLWIVVDALRADMLDPQIMPNVYGLSEKSQVFENHFSGGNATRTGIFTMFYGIPGNYFDTARILRRGAVLVHQLLKNDYQLGIYASAPLNMPEFDQTVFAEVKNLRVESKSSQTYGRDIEITNEWLKFLNHRDPKKPFFGFVFYDSPHGYDFPPDFKLKFLPIWDKVDYLALHNDFDPTPFKNRYKNSVLFNDGLIEKILGDLQAKGLMKNTVIMITGDHGQEFNDNHLNYWGHNSNFSDAQTHVPMIVWWPGKAPQKYTHRTDHYDLSPTLLQEIFKCKNPASDYSSGDDLFKGISHPWIVMGTYGNFAIYRDNDIISVPYSGEYEMLDHHWHETKSQFNANDLQQALQEMSRFY
jgi:membrane-anchored protein YejM (alkaline phosphatase superfamily)